MTSPSTIQPKFLSKGNELGVVSVGFSGGQSKPGVDTAPTALVASGLLTQLAQDLHYTVHHDTITDVNNSSAETNGSNPDPPLRGMKNPRAVSAVTRALSHQVYEHARQGRMVLTLGGDHSVAIGSVAGMSRAVREKWRAMAEQNVHGNPANGDVHGLDGPGDSGLAVIWVDAHADINTPGQSTSGNIHGMPLAWLTGLAQREREKQLESGQKEGPQEEEKVFGWLEEDEPDINRRGNAPILLPHNLIYIGLRDVDAAEKLTLRALGIKAFSMHDIDKHGIGNIMTQALSHIGPTTPIHLSFDVDALDPQWAPGTGTPVRGGLTLREGDYIAECVHETGKLVAMDLVEVNPALEGNGPGQEETVRAGCSLVRCALGDTLL